MVVKGVGRLLPWWLCLVLALVSYVVLHAFVTRPPAPIDPKQLTGMVVNTYALGLAMVGQYILPIGFVAAAAVSYVGRRQRRQLVERATGSNAADAMAGMRWEEFEQLIGEGFRLQGYQVEERTRGGADGGIDLVLRRGSEKFLVQAKHWKAFKVGVDVVRSLYGLMAAHGAAGGFVVTSGSFTSEASAFAEGRNVRLVDGPKLEQMLRQAKAGGGEVRASPPRASTAPAVAVTPACPDCTKPMVLRQARRGANAGNAFWGCSAFSAGCRGTRAS